MLERSEKKTSEVQLSLLLTVQFDEHGPELVHLATTSYPLPSLEVGRMTQWIVRISWDHGNIGIPWLTLSSRIPSPFIFK